MAADRFAQRVDDERCADRLGLEQVGRGHGAVHHIQQAALGAELADALQVRDLGARIGHGLHEDHAGFRTQRRLHVGGFCCVDQADFAAKLCQGVHPAGGVAEQVAAGHDVIAFSQQRHHGRTDRGHAGGKAHRAHGVFHQADLGFQRLGRRIALPPVDVAGTLAPEHGREFLGRGIAIAVAMCSGLSTAPCSTEPSRSAWRMRVMMSFGISVLSPRLVIPDLMPPGWQGAVVWSCEEVGC